MSEEHEFHQKIGLELKKTLSFFALVFALLPFCVHAQHNNIGETDRENVSQQGVNDTNFLNQDTTIELSTILDSLKRLELDITFQLVKSRVELVDAKINASETLGLSSQENSQLEKAQHQTRRLELALAELKQQITILEETVETAIAPQSGKPKSTTMSNFPEERTQNKREVQSLPMTSIPANDIANGILLLPPKVPCEGGISAIDPTTKKEHWETGATQLFSHTDIALEQMFTKADLITCTGYLTALSGGIRLLNLEFVVSIANAPEIFGNLPSGEFIEFALLDGQRIRLFNGLSSNGQWIPNLNSYVVKGRYNLGFREEKLLRSQEVWSVLVRWGKVQETYLIYEVDFFLRQLACLDELMKLR